MPADSPGPLPPTPPDAFERRLKAIAAAVAVVGVVVTAFTAAAGFYQTARTQAVTAATPYLQNKLKWCEEASELASYLAVHGKSADKNKHSRTGPSFSFLAVQVLKLTNLALPADLDGYCLAGI